MKFAICNETFVDWPHAKAFQFAVECGYTGIEIAPFTLGPDVGSITPQKRLEIGSLAADKGLEVVGLHWLLAHTEGLHLTSPEASVRRRTADYLGELARLCRDLGGSVLVLGSPRQRDLMVGVSSDEGADYAVEVLQACLPALEATDTTLALEPLGPGDGNFWNTAADVVSAIERVGSPHCRLHLDCRAMSTEASLSSNTSPSSEALSIPELIARYAPLMAHFHANDPNKQGPGFGELDFHPILSALGQVDYQGWVSVEVFDHAPGIERLARESIEYLQDCLADLAE